MQPGGYVAMRLCGLDASQAFIDTSYLHFSGFADNERSRWSAALCAKFGLSMEKLPRIVRPAERAGSLTGAMAEACGLRAGTPVMAGCGDTAAAFLACGATERGPAATRSGRRNERFA